MNDKVELINRINVALDTIRPHLAVDGGDVEVVDVTEAGVVQIKWLGNCEGCSMSIMTMKAGIEQVVLSKIPEIKGIEAVNGVTVK